MAQKLVQAQFQLDGGEHTLVLAMSVPRAIDLIQALLYRIKSHPAHGVATQVTGVFLDAVYDDVEVPA